jgi:hypothetical protein
MKGFFGAAQTLHGFHSRPERRSADTRAHSILGALTVGGVLVMGGQAALAQDAGAPAMAMPPAAPTSPVSTPSIAGPLSGNITPLSLDLGPLGDKVYVTGAVTGLVFAQDNATRFVKGDNSSGWDLTNGQVFVQKVDGVLQYFIEVGSYSLPSLGTPYFSSSSMVPATFGVVPQAFLKLALADNFSVMAGKLPTLVGAEYTFTFENMDIFRGLLWNQEPAVSRGVQVNYTAGPLAFSASVNDGYYSNRFNWASGSVAYTIDMENTISFVGAGNLAHTDYATSATPYFQNNGAIYNLIFTHTAGPWIITPYVQYSDVSADAKIGIPHSASTTGLAVLASYAVDDFFKIAGRVEYIDTTGKGSSLAKSTNLLFGPDSNAWTFTVTPTYQYKAFFVRAEYSIVAASKTTAGFAMGPKGTGTSQNRVALETGILF